MKEKNAMGVVKIFSVLSIILGFLVPLFYLFGLLYNPAGGP
jgi:hypothetical protein